MFRVPAATSSIVMETRTDLVSSDDASPEVSCQLTTATQQIGSEYIDDAPISNNNRLEPKTGDHHMESRIPEESAVTLPYGASTSSNTSSTPGEGTTTPHQQPPPPSKRPRIASSSGAGAAGGSGSREYLNLSAQQLIDEINEKRKADTLLLADFKKAMEMQVATSYGLLEQTMYQMYERNGKIMQSKLQELFATLDRIAKLESELQQFKHALGALYTDIQAPS